MSGGSENTVMFNLLHDRKKIIRRLLFYFFKVLTSQFPLLTSPMRVGQEMSPIHEREKERAENTIVLFIEHY